MVNGLDDSREKEGVQNELQHRLQEGIKEKLMSYDIRLMGTTCATCGREGREPDDLPDPTYNLTPIFDFALTGEERLPNGDITEMEVVIYSKPTDRPRGLRLLDGLSGKASLELLDKALQRFNDASLREKFVALEPPNHWGDLEGAIRVIGKLFAAASEFPSHVWRIR